MKKLISMIAMLLLTIVISVNSIGEVKGVNDDFNWVQWYEWNGVYTVTSSIKGGDLSPIEACDKIIIPAYNAGKVTENQLNIFIEEIPEAKDYLITLQHLQQSRLLSYLHTL